MSEAGAVTPLPTSVADRIRSEIVKRRLKPGDVVGTETQLAADMKISRNMVREGIGQLRGLGLVKPNRRKGIVVAQPDPAETLSLVIPQYVVNHATLSELAQLRCSLEIGCVEAAVDGATEAEILRLKKLASDHMRLASDPNTSGEMVDEIEIAFHETILSATGNALLKSMHRVIVAFFRRGPVELPNWTLNDAPTALEHIRIAEAFAERDAGRASELLKAHFRPYLKSRNEME